MIALLLVTVLIAMIVTVFVMMATAIIIILIVVLTLIVLIVLMVFVIILVDLAITRMLVMTMTVPIEAINNMRLIAADRSGSQRISATTKFDVSGGLKGRKRPLLLIASGKCTRQPVTRVVLERTGMNTYDCSDPFLCRARGPRLRGLRSPT